MARDHAAEWDELGRRDPHWAILSDPGRQGEWADDPFFAGGRAEIDATMREVGPFLVATDDALDFGCGLGRLTQALAVHFTAVVGIDIAQSMVDGARSRNAFDERVSYVVNTAATLPFDDASFDFGYSTMVLQHVPPKAARRYIAELVRVLRPGGVLVFSELSHRAPTLRNAVRLVVPALVLRWLRQRRFGWAAAITMHGVRRRRVCAAIEAAGGELISARPDGAGRPVWRSYRYTVRRLPAR
ncbi:MAG TPA: class I SAM-dependent methyltransferase [Acidothermaceae bacterium]